MIQHLVFKIRNSNLNLNLGKLELNLIRFQTMCLLYVYAYTNLHYGYNHICVLDIIVGWCLGQGLPSRAMVEAMGKDVAGILVSMNLSAVGLYRKS